MSEINKLRWQCRRGSRELDLILLNYLENVYTQADISQQQGFAQLLSLEDIEIMRYLLGETKPENEVMRKLLAAINTQPI